MKGKALSLIIEGILFCGSGLGLLSYSLLSFGNSFQKDWTQSPYLFPLLVGICLAALSLCLMGDGWKAYQKNKSAEIQTAPSQSSSGKQDGRKKFLRVLTVVGICAVYYLGLEFLSLPQVTIGIFSFYCTFSVFEVMTVVFVAAMMAFMGVRKPILLVLVPLGTTLFLSVAFRSFLHVLLP